MDLLHVYCHVYNGGPILAYWLRHYQRLPATRLLVYFDKDNSDHGPALVEACPIAERRVSPLTGPRDLERARWASVEIRQSIGQALWALWVDDDELLWKKGLADYLAQQPPEVRILHARDAYSMAAEVFPTTDGQIYSEVRRGLLDYHMGKPTLTRPDTPLQWCAGKHRVELSPYPVTEAPELTWMHFRHLGDTYIQQRNDKMFQRWDPLNTALGHGANLHPDKLGEFLAKRREIMDKGIDIQPEGLYDAD